MLDLDPQQLKHRNSLSWDEVFNIWRGNEADRLNWIEHYTNRGFATWDEWRQRYAEAFKCSKREWHLYKITNPLVLIPSFHGGPFQTWIERHYGGNPKPTFAELAERADMQQHAGLKDLLDHFPTETTVTGLVQNGEIIIIEGMHRCVAVALAARQHVPLATTIHIALADVSSEALPVVGQFTKAK